VWLFAGAPLLLIPLALSVEPVIIPESSDSPPSWLKAVVNLGLLPSGLLITLAMVLLRGWLAFAVCLPWLLVSIVLSWQASQGWREQRYGWVRLAARLYLVIGALWAAAYCLGLRLLAFPDAIVLLTSVHFHYAGFGMPMLAYLASAGPPHKGASSDEDPQADLVAALACLGSVGSVPLVAAGITASQVGAGPWLETAAGWLQALSGLLVAWIYIRQFSHRHFSDGVRTLWGLAGICLAAGMVLAASYASRWIVPNVWLTLPSMWALHGSFNVLGISAALAGWWIASDRRLFRPAPILCLFV
jgi:hypothetical protein